jgi:hypothetical protein
VIVFAVDEMRNYFNSKLRVDLGVTHQSHVLSGVYTTCQCHSIREPYMCHRIGCVIKALSMYVRSSNAPSLSYLQPS